MPRGDTLGHQLRGHVDWPVSVSDKGNNLGVGSRVLHLCKGTHPFDDLKCWAEEVDGMAATAET